jgi:predicted Zn-dependent peptidase
LGQIVQRLVDEGVRPEELSQAINKTTAGYIMQSERPGNRLFSLGGRYLLYNNYMSLDESLDQIRAVDQAQVADVAKRYLNEQPLEIRAVAAAG